MTDNTLENQGQPIGTDSVPTQSVQVGATPADSGGGFDQEAVLKRLNELDGLVRSLQSGKDKGVKKLTDEVDSLKEQLERYEKLRSKGLDPEDAQYRMEMEQLLAERRRASGPSAVPVQGGGGSPTQSASVDHTALLTGLRLDPNSAEVLNVLRSTDDPVMQEATFRAISAMKQGKPIPVSNPAQQVPVGGGVSVSERTIEDVERDIINVKQSGGLGSPKHRELVEEHRKMLQRR